MVPSPRPRRPWRAATTGLLAGALAGAAAIAVALGLEERRDLSAHAAPVERAADALARDVHPARTVQARARIALVGLPARLVGPAGRVRAQSGAPAVWDAGSASWHAALATLGAGGWSVRDGAIEARRSLAGGGAVVVRAPLPPGAGRVDAVGPLAIAVGLMGLAGALVAAGLDVRRGRRLRALTAVAEGAAAGRSVPAAAAGRGEWRALAEAVGAASDRAVALQGVAEARIDALGAALAPLAMPVAARMPSGGLIRNDALERMLGTLAPADAGALEDAVAAGLAAGGPVGTRLALADGRALEVESWSVPGGRVVAVGERTAQARMEAMRRQVSGAAARHLHAPLEEVRARCSELMGQVPSDAAPAVRAIQAAGDRMDRLVGQLLRGTSADPRARPVRPRAVGAPGLAYGLGATFDRRLRDRGLRLETDLPDDLPAIRADPALVHEILCELIANAATATPRGGTIRLEGRTSPGDRVVLSVTDTGPGIAPDELDLVAEPFGRGAGAAGLPGAGLGLGVARALAERLGGGLILQAGPGGAARLELPAHRAEDDGTATDPPALSREPVAVP